MPTCRRREYKIYPAIDANGDFFELEVHVNHQYFQRPKQTVARACGYTSLHEAEVYKKQDFDFAVDADRRAKVEVFISEDFKGLELGETRREVIEAYIRSQAPWVFTYGKRINYRRPNE
jgi:hypothetical protein